MPDYAEVAGVASMYANGMGHQSHNSTSPLYDSCGAYATTSLIGTTNIYHQNRHYDNSSSAQQQHHQQAAHYNNVIRSGPFVYPNKKTSSTSLNTPENANSDGGAARDKLNNTFGGNRNNTLSFGIRNRLMKMNITENKMDILINNLGPKGSLNGGGKSVVQKGPSQNGNAEPVNPIPPPTPNLGSTRRNQFLANGNVNGQKKNLFPNEAPPPPPQQIMKSYLDPATDEEEEWTQEGEEGLRSCDRVNGNVNSNHNNNNNSTSNCNSPRNKSQRQQLLAGDNQSLTAKNQTPPHKSNKSLNSSSSSSSSPYHMINHSSGSSRTGGGGGHPDSSGSSSSSTSNTCPNNNTNNGGNGGWNSTSSNGSGSSPLTKSNFAGSDNQINGCPNYMKSFGKTDNV